MTYLLITGHYGVTQTFYYFNDFSACWHVTSIHTGPHVGAPFLWGPCSDEHAEHAQIRL